MTAIAPGAATGQRVPVLGPGRTGAAYPSVGCDQRPGGGIAGPALLEAADDECRAGIAKPARKTAAGAGIGRVDHHRRPAGTESTCREGIDGALGKKRTGRCLRIPVGEPEAAGGLARARCHAPEAPAIGKPADADQLGAGDPAPGIPAGEHRIQPRIGPQQPGRSELARPGVVETALAGRTCPDRVPAVLAGRRQHQCPRPHRRCRPGGLRNRWPSGQPVDRLHRGAAAAMDDRACCPATAAPGDVVVVFGPAPRQTAKTEDPAPPEGLPHPDPRKSTFSWLKTEPEPSAATQLRLQRRPCMHWYCKTARNPEFRPQELQNRTGENCALADCIRHLDSPPPGTNHPSVHLPALGQIHHRRPIQPDRTTFSGLGREATQACTSHLPRAGAGKLRHLGRPSSTDNHGPLLKMLRNHNVL